jgi:hypothetical protein
MGKASVNATMDTEDIMFMDNLVENDNFPEFKTRGDVFNKALALLKKELGI